jgi:hypothetical protein
MHVIRDIGVPPVVNDRRVGLHSGFGRRDGGQLTVLDLDELGRVVGERGGLGDDGGDRLTDESDPVGRDGVPHEWSIGKKRRVLNGRRLHPVGEVPPGDDRDDTVGFSSGARVNGHDVGVGIGRASEDDVQRSGGREVIDEAAVAGDQGSVAGATN